MRVSPVTKKRELLKAFMWMFAMFVKDFIQIHYKVKPSLAKLPESFNQEMNIRPAWTAGNQAWWNPDLSYKSCMTGFTSGQAELNPATWLATRAGYNIPSSRLI